MGFLSNMKKNLTGSWAEVTLVVDRSAVRRGEALPVRVDVQVGDDDVAVTSVIVEVSCEEVVDVRSVVSRASSTTSVDGLSSEVRESLHHEETIIASSLTLAAGSSQRFEGQVRLPQHAPGTARGRYSEFRWSARARLDVKGNDPDSGWTTLEVS
jgi:hypothetical protein